MADYYPLIARAIAGLDPNAPGESRRALYERSRAALIAQLRSVQPPLTEQEITRERLSLEDACRKVEAEAAQRAREAAQTSRDRFDLQGLMRRAEERQRRAAPGGAANDPLAELARLIGQNDPFRAPSAPSPVEDPGSAGRPEEPHLPPVPNFDQSEVPHPMRRFGAE